jgi:hypothetical protein
MLGLREEGTGTPTLEFLDEPRAEKKRGREMNNEEPLSNRSEVIAALVRIYHQSLNDEITLKEANKEITRLSQLLKQMEDVGRNAESAG